MRPSHQIKIFRHLYFTAITDIIDSSRATALQSGDGDACQIVGVNVIGVDIIFVAQDRSLAAQTLERQPIRGVYPRDAQNDNRDPIARSPFAELRLRIKPPPGAEGRRRGRTSFRNQLSRAVAIHSAGTNVEETPW